MRKVITAAVQMQCAPDVETNLDTAERLIRQAADRGAQIILLPSCLSAFISVRSGGTAITATQCRQPKRGGTPYVGVAKKRTCAAGEFYLSVTGTPL